MRSRAASCCSWRAGGYAGTLQRPGAAASMVREALVGERVAIDSYRQMVAFAGADDPTTRRLLEGILAVAEQHAEALARLLEGLGEPCEEQIDRALDEALEETFPASDPPATIVPAPRCSS